MTPTISEASFVVLWGMFWGYWIFRACSARQGVRLEASGSRLIHAALLTLTLSMLTIARVDPLTARLLPASNFIIVFGFIIASLGLGLAVWARSYLGLYWSGAITFQADHQLIHTGPYALVRHPIYTGMLTGILGTAIAIGELRGLLALLFAVIAYYRKIRMEEDRLALRFGEAYTLYRKQVRMLVPFVL